MAAAPALWPAGLAPPLLGAAGGLLRFRAAGWRLGDEHLVLRSARLARTTLVTRPGRLQEHSLGQDPLQRRAALADLGVAVGSGRRAGVAHLEAEVARGPLPRLPAAAPA